MLELRYPRALHHDLLPTSKIKLMNLVISMAVILAVIQIREHHLEIGLVIINHQQHSIQTTIHKTITHNV